MTNSTTLAPYTISENEIDNFVNSNIKVKELTYSRKHVKLICSFDIEVSSFYNENNEKQALMYCWQFAINESVIIGRTIEQFVYLLDKLHRKTNSSEEKTLIIYVHNLAYEFQFIRKYLEWSNVFALEPRKVLYATTTSGIEFRCSYLLTNVSLEKLATYITTKPIKKLKETYDYELIRTPYTELTELEKQYCINDVLIITRWIAQELQQQKFSLDTIPYTKTGYVRKYCRTSTKHYDGLPARDPKSVRQYQEFRTVIESLTIEPQEYNLLKQAFQGGFTHANAEYVNEIMLDVDSIDFTSSYPATMICEKFPMSKGSKIEIHSLEHLRECLNKYCCVFLLKLDNVQAKIKYENYITQSKCTNLINPVLNNGRVVSCDSLIMAVTDIDFKIIKQCYTYENIYVTDFYIYERAYLPTPLVKSILKLYENKTKLKGVPGSEIEYMNSKAMLNSVYGMTVTDISKDETLYQDNEWSLSAANVVENMEKYNTSKNRFLFYPWGVFVTAYARRNLWSGILEFKNDYIYSDTDSIKCINYNNHIDYINSYNEYTRYKMYRACDFHGLPYDCIEPKTIKGVTKLLGAWDLETENEPYTQFKTLGAKRYIYEERNKLHCTIAGVSKRCSAEYLELQQKPFYAFKDGLYFPTNYAGKLTHSYIDNEIQGVVKDYNGLEYVYSVQSCIHLEKSDYSLTMACDFKQFLSDLKGGKK